MVATKEEKRYAAKVVRRLRRDYPDATCALNFKNPLQLLIATILSAQCTDERVNMVTKDLFRKYRSSADFAKAPISDLERAIQSTGFFRNKAKSIKSCCTQLMDEHNGKVPPDLDELVQLAGVGRKTGNVVLGTAFKIPSGVVVDTHVGRISYRLGLTTNKDPIKIENDLMGQLPRREWIDYSHRMIHHGRRVCKAQAIVRRLLNAGYLPTNRSGALMILSGDEILKRLGSDIIIEPFDRSLLNPNSCNLTLHDEIMTYEEVVLDMRKLNRTRRMTIPPEGVVLNPSQLYLGRTAERTETHNLVPMIEGRSSVGRLGLFVHVTAGFGDVGFRGYWTLEIFAVQPVRIYPGVPICQIFYHEIVGDVSEYASDKYQNNNDIQPSLFYKELNPGAGQDDPQQRLNFDVS